MLSNIMLCVLAIMTPILCVWSFKQGTKYARPVKISRTQKKEQKKAKVKADKELEKMNTLIANIGNYDGTANGQRKI